MPATYVTSTSVVCAAPPGGDAVCEGEYVNVILYGQTSANYVRLKRVPTPTLISASVQSRPFASMFGGSRDHRAGIRICDVARTVLPRGG